MPRTPPLPSPPRLAPLPARAASLRLPLALLAVALAAAGCRDFAADFGDCVDAGRCVAGPSPERDGGTGVDDGGLNDAGTDADAGVDAGADAGPAETCSNGTDDDGDALADCLDPDCLGEICRPAADGGCDAKERCDAQQRCPADAFLPATVECRPAQAGGCNFPAKCPGDRAECPPNPTSCDAGLYCDGVACQPQRALGANCVAPSMCLSGFCANGRCCDRACDGACESCSDAGACRFFGSGTRCRDAGGDCDLDEFCTGDAGACPADVRRSATLCRASVGACDLGAVCDGGISCPPSEPAPTTAVCVAAACDGGTFLAEARCLGDGGCGPRSSAPQVCSPFACNARGCPSSCSAQADCATGFYCQGGTCVAQKPTGSACQSGAECQLGFCVDNVCCGTACNGACEACNNSGQCVALPAGSQDPACGPYLCAGGRACAGSCVQGACTSPTCAPSAYCTTAGVCRTGPPPPGVSCVTQCDCGAGVACTDFYADADADTYTDPRPVKFCGSPPPGQGYRSTPTSFADCCDRDPSAHPGQLAFFQFPSLCGDREFDCDGFPTLEFPLQTDCPPPTFVNCGNPCNRCVGTYQPGWENLPPACGDFGVFTESCGPHAQSVPCPICFDSITVCVATGQSSRPQRCR